MPANIATGVVLSLALACKDKAQDSGSGIADTGDTGAAAASPNHDPLSMPAEPTLDMDAFESAETCAGCHSTHYAQWRTSMHAYAMVDPVYRALVEVRQQDLGGAQDQFCTQCHSPIGTRGGDIVPGFAWEELEPITLEGITCESCHKVSGIERLYNSGHVLDPEGPMRGTIQDPESVGFHADQGMEYADFFESSDFCGACHDAVEMTGLPLERPYEEWTESPAADEGKTCQDCHMPETTGYAAEGAAQQRTLHDHRWVGVDIPLVDGWLDPDELEASRVRVQALLDTAATVVLELPDQVEAGEQLDVVVTIRNEIDAHNLPTGSTFLRQVWLELVATDADGQVLYTTGDLDANGDLRDHWSELDPYGDDDLILLSSGFLDADGNPTLFTHDAAEHVYSSISPLYDRTYTLFVPTDAASSGPITVAARLRLRPFAPHLLRRLDLEELVDQVETYDLDAVTDTVELVAGR